MSHITLGSAEDCIKTLLGAAEVENSFTVLLNRWGIIIYKQTLYFNDQYVTTEILRVVVIADF